MFEKALFLNSVGDSNHLYIGDLVRVRIIEPGRLPGHVLGPARVLQQVRQLGYQVSYVQHCTVHVQLVILLVQLHFLKQTLCKSKHR